MPSVGRNDPCHCGSGKKYKRCHLPIQEKAAWSVPPPIPPEILNKFREHERKEHERIERFGFVKPEIAIDFQGHKLVAVGSRVYHGKKWKFFWDFLQDYVPLVFGREWGESELAKPFDQRHTVIQWRQRCLEFLNRQEKTSDGFYAVIPNGFAAACFALAYDLYLVEHNERLDGEVIKRLKHPDQFQGARHELFAEATCIRAGFKVERENEKDRTKRHAEFTATHKSMGQTISVEAKSKHRPGVLGRMGTTELDSEINLRFGSLINDAVAKNPPHPLVVFLDTNLPPTAAARFYGRGTATAPEISTYVKKLIDRIGNLHRGKDPFVLLVLTNHPHHYSETDAPDPRKHLVSIYSQIPSTPALHPSAIMGLHRAAELYGNIPNEFPHRDQ